MLFVQTYVVKGLLIIMVRRYVTCQTGSSNSLALVASRGVQLRGRKWLTFNV
jgi:hypothetical protein